MSERPILFSGPMVRAILERRKTQTRRIVKDVDHARPLMVWCNGATAEFKEGHDDPSPVVLPYYAQRGDTLWVRETWRHYGNESRNGGAVHAHVTYRADDTNLVRGSWSSFTDAPKRSWWNTWRKPWTPAIHMPRWASRISLRVTSVRVERLTVISDEDALAEGVTPEGANTPRSQFAKLWDDINGKRAAWRHKPWVWVVGFEVLP